MSGKAPSEHAMRRDGPAGEAVTPLGPPGWEEYAGARATFFRTLALETLERAWTARAAERRGHTREVLR
jgi:hypothetical protein